MLKNEGFRLISDFLGFINSVLFRFAFRMLMDFGVLNLFFEAGNFLVRKLVVVTYVGIAFFFPLIFSNLRLPFMQKNEYNFEFRMIFISVFKTVFFQLFHACCLCS